MTYHHQGRVVGQGERETSLPPMSEYEYGGAQFVDITREFMTATVCNYKEYLRTSVSVGGEVELAPTFELEDAVSSVDV